MDNLELIQKLVNDRSNLKSKINSSSFNGSIEVKTVGNEKYIYVRRREAGKNTSTYIDKYSDDLYVLAINQASQIRAAKKELRSIEKTLASLGYEEKDISSRVRLNIDFARANVKTLIYDQAVLEGVGTTFPQTETILENGHVYGVKANDIQKILNLKHAWEFILDPNVVISPSNFYLVSQIAKLINEGFYLNGGDLRKVPVSIGGSSYIPPIPKEADIKDRIQNIVSSSDEEINKAIDLALYCMKTQTFIDGNKRASIIFANHYMIQNGLGLLVVPEKEVENFKSLLVKYYEGVDDSYIKDFLKEKCWRKF